MRHWSSKKWTAAMVGTGCVLAVFAIGSGAVLLAAPEKAAYLSALANTATVAISALLTSLVAGQSCVDWRHGSATRYETQDLHAKEEKIERVFAPKHYDDPAVS
ncbi:MAG: hypothetical protein NTZ46_12055 [Verrucomicrobia bacterium]|nr:hypothetical protein [Verrucomicrobiota bacterium]